MICGEQGATHLSGIHCAAFLPQAVHHYKIGLLMMQFSKGVFDFIFTFQGESNNGLARLFVGTGVLQHVRIGDKFQG